MKIVKNNTDSVTIDSYIEECKHNNKIVGILVWVSREGNVHIASDDIHLSGKQSGIYGFIPLIMSGGRIKGVWYSKTFSGLMDSLKDIASSKEHPGELHYFKDYEQFGKFLSLIG